MANHRARLAMILGEAVRPYDRTFERLCAFTRRLDDAGEPYPDELELFFRGDGEGAGQDRQAADRRAQAVRWALERGPSLPEWMELAGVSLDDGAVAEEAPALE